MKETSFIKKHIENWKAFELEFNKKQKNPSLLSKLFIKITDDSSYARTFYPNRTVKYYLNGLSQQLYFSLYSHRKNRSKEFLEFWTQGLPAIMWHARKDLLISFVVFTLSIAAGYFSCVQDPDFVYQILGSGYVEMTINNIERGDPLAVYKDSDAFNMFFRITWNNLRVAMITFMFGLFLGVGTFGILVGNGIMVGVFHHLFFRYDLGTEAILTILQHGALELSAIVIAGAAGIKIVRAWFFPGNYTRGQSFRYNI